MNKNLIVTSAILATALLGVVSPVRASVSCSTQYGASEVCVKTGDLQVNKEVLDPKTNKFVDNMTVEGYHFAPSEEVTFRIKVKNSGDATLNNIKVTDTLPTSILEAINSGDLSYQIDSLNVDQTVERTFKVRAVNINNFPKNKTVACEYNVAKAQAGDKNAQDMSQVCIEKKATSSLPKAGAEGVISFMIGSLASAVAGFKLMFRKKIK